MDPRCLIFAILLGITSCASQPPGEFVPYYEVETRKPYDEVLAELEVAIAENNFRITGHSRVGKVIRDRGTKNFPEYDTIQFCNLTEAKTILLMSPQAIRHMPCNVVTYQFQGKTVIRSHLLPTDTDNKALNEFSVRMNQVLKKMVDFAAEE
ncbi:putative lipoprotein [Methyloglobulus morosus KoM1]|uniref:Putative lipoprotein n=1 Tax=Methyloglobulus morosus KoM1 TaxID=1116472 RepID=V5CB80_9GAMM|nr:DUF302 domain-containing protein [Methyloglobulus morosus]ESS74063.1 putative lipoprotein [Methyloglobulus morosus KoM1]